MPIDEPREAENEGEYGYGVAPPAFRMPASARLGRVRLQVADLGRSLAYYREVLGLRLLQQAGGRAVLGAQDGGPALVELREQPGASPVPQRGRLGLFHFAILLPDRAALGRFLLHLGRTETRAGMSDHLVSEAIYLQDPDGLGIEVYADRPRAAWRHQGRELVMDTRPLDTADLLEAGAGEPWTGMPAGTTVGHVHLHVGDLDAAAAYYHEGLGLDAVVWSYPGALFLSAGGYHHHLGVNTWAGARAERPRPDDARLLEWTILLPHAGVEAAAHSLEAAGHEVAYEGRDRLAADPWGTTLRLADAAGEEDSRPPR